jgi:hypothetical protein
VLQDLVTQRWGIGSTRLHLEAERLALGVLLFDRLVLPTPSDVAEGDRWDALGWNTEAQARRIVQLGELVHFAPWDERLRNDWRESLEQLKRIGAQTRELAFMMTPQVIAQSAWTDVVAYSNETGMSPQARPVPVIWATRPRQVVRAEVRPVTGPYERVSAIKFRRVLEQPVRADPEATLDAALKLANDPEFQNARRALYTAEALAATGAMTPREFAARMDDAVARYNDLVTAYERGTMRRVIHHVVPAAAGGAAMLTQVPGAGGGGRWTASNILARLLPLPAAPDAARDEGSAIALTERAMAAVIAGTPATTARPRSSRQ